MKLRFNKVASVKKKPSWILFSNENTTELAIQVLSPGLSIKDLRVYHLGKRISAKSVAYSWRNGNFVCEDVEMEIR